MINCALASRTWNMFPVPFVHAPYTLATRVMKCMSPGKLQTYPNIQGIVRGAWVFACALTWMKDECQYQALCSCDNSFSSRWSSGIHPISITYSYTPAMINLLTTILQLEKLVSQQWWHLFKYHVCIDNVLLCMKWWKANIGIIKY